MTEKVNGFAAGNDQFVSGAMKMYQITVGGLDMTAAAANGTSDLTKVVDAISTRAQPVIMGVPTATTMVFAVEHNEVFGDLVAFADEVEAATGATADSVVIAAFAI